jgi:D-3-phosphoglycerate dehydrogenase
VKLFSIQREHIETLVPFLKSKVSESIVAHRSFLRSYADRIFIISGGFREYIVPVVEEFGISASHVFANTFVFDERGSVTGFDTSAFLAQDQGKVKQLAALGLSDEIWVIGDGYTDFQMREGRENCLFFAYTENVLREKVVHNLFSQHILRIRKKQTVLSPFAHLKIRIPIPNYPYFVTQTKRCELLHLPLILS